MVTLLTSNNSAVFRQLASRAFQRLELAHRVATSGEEALAFVQKERPAMVILDAELPGIDGYEVCRRIKEDPVLRSVRVMLVTGNVLTPAHLDKVQRSGCDDVFCVPAPSDELYQHVAQLLGLPYRVSRRVALHLNVELTSGPRTIEGQLINLSRTGAKIALTDPLTIAPEVSVRMSRSERGPKVVVPARVVWQRDVGESGVQLGIQFHNVTHEAQQFIDSLALWEVQMGDGVIEVTLLGDFSETTNFSELWHHLGTVHSPIEFDLANVRALNSWGVRNWVAFLEALPASLEYVFVRASVAFVTQAGM